MSGQTSPDGLRWRSVFLSYAHANRRMADEAASVFKTAFESEFNGANGHPRAKLWYDQDQSPGAHWEGVTLPELEAADIVLFLVTEESLTAGYMWEKEFPVALQRMKAQGVRLIPLVASRVSAPILTHPETKGLNWAPRPHETCTLIGEPAWLQRIASNLVSEVTSLNAPRGKSDYARLHAARIKAHTQIARARSFVDDEAGQAFAPLWRIEIERALFITEQALSLYTPELLRSLEIAHWRLLEVMLDVEEDLPLTKAMTALGKTVAGAITHARGGPKAQLPAVVSTVFVQTGSPHAAQAASALSETEERLQLLSEADQPEEAIAAQAVGAAVEQGEAHVAMARALLDETFIDTHAVRNQAGALSRAMTMLSNSARILPEEFGDEVRASAKGLTRSSRAAVKHCDRLSEEALTLASRPALNAPYAGAERPRPARVVSENTEPIGDEVEVAEIVGRVRQSSIKRMAELVDQHPEESVATIRAWLNSDRVQPPAPSQVAFTSDGEQTPPAPLGRDLVPVERVFDPPEEDVEPDTPEQGNPAEETPEEEAPKYRLQHRRRVKRPSAQELLQNDVSPPPPPQEETPEQSLAMDRIRVELGFSLLPLINDVAGRRLTDQIKALRKTLAQEFGFVMPSVRVLDNVQLAPDQYQIMIDEMDVGHGVLKVDGLLAMDPTGAGVVIDGEAVKEPAFGLDAKWIAADAREQASFRGYTVVDPATVLATHLTELVKGHMSATLNFHEMKKLLSALPQDTQSLLESVIPIHLSWAGVLRILQNLLRERVSIRPLEAIVEAIVEAAPFMGDLVLITEHVRARLARQILHSHRNGEGALPIITLSPFWEQAFAEALTGEGANRMLALAPSRLHDFVDDTRKAFERAAQLGETPVLITSAGIRPYVRSLVERFRPATAVLSQVDLDAKQRLKTMGQVTPESSRDLAEPVVDAEAEIAPDDEPTPVSAEAGIQSQAPLTDLMAAVARLDAITDRLAGLAPRKKTKKGKNKKKKRPKRS